MKTANSKGQRSVSILGTFCVSYILPLGLRSPRNQVQETPIPVDPKIGGQGGFLLFVGARRTSFSIFKIQLFSEGTSVVSIVELRGRNRRGMSVANKERLIHRRAGRELLIVWEWTARAVRDTVSCVAQRAYYRKRIFANPAWDSYDELFEHTPPTNARAVMPVVSLR